MTPMSKFFRMWVTGIVTSQIRRALEQLHAYGKQLGTAYVPTDHIFPHCNDNSGLCRRLLIADLACVCLMLTCHKNWFFRFTILLVCLCSNSHFKRIYTLGFEPGRTRRIFPSEGK
jgi:hypothetical protein